MARYQIAYHKILKKAVVQSYGDALPANESGQAYINIGDFYHQAAQDDLGDNPASTELADENHVFYQHVRDALYKRSAANASNTAMFPNNITDMASITILTDVAGVNAGADFSLAVSETRQLYPTFTPAELANDQAVTYASADPTKATVSSTGLVTAVATGSSVITVSVGGETDTVTVTVTA